MLVNSLNGWGKDCYGRERTAAPQMKEDGKTERELLDAVRRSPESDLPRLAYARWLTEHDSGDGEHQARARLIYTQLALSRLDIDDAERKNLERCEHDLLTSHRNHRKWTQPLCDLGATNIVFRRGFAEGIEVSAKDFLRYGQEILAHAPIREIRISKCTSNDLVALAASPHLADLTSLDLSYNELGPEDARVLAASRHLTSLRSLSLHNNSIGDNGTRFLASSKYLKNLTSLNLCLNGLTDGGAQLLAHGPGLMNLNCLNIGHNEVSADGARSLVASKRLSKLVSLDLSSNRLELPLQYQFERDVRYRHSRDQQRDHGIRSH